MGSCCSHSDDRLGHKERSRVRVLTSDQPQLCPCAVWWSGRRQVSYPTTFTSRRRRREFRPPSSCCLAGLPLASGPRVVREVAGIALASASVEERAEACLESLLQVRPFQAGWIGLLDPERREHVLLAHQG